MRLTILKKANDPITDRISIGGNREEAYIVYRGDLPKIKLLLDAVNEEFRKLEKEPPVSDDMGKRFA